MSSRTFRPTRPGTRSRNCRATAFDHHHFIDAAVGRLRAKLSYTNIGFALAPREFTIAELRDLFGAALGYQLGATNLTRVLTRRHVIDPTDRRASSGQSGGRPGHRLQVRDPRAHRQRLPFAVLRPARAEAAP